MGEIHFVGAAMDVTAAKRSQQALEQAFREIKTLKDQLQSENTVLREEVDKASMFEQFVGTLSACETCYLDILSCSDRFQCSDHRGDWHGQGTGCPCYSQAFPAIRTRLCECELFSHSTRLDRIRIVRP